MSDPIVVDFSSQQRKQKMLPPSTSGLLVRRSVQFAETSHVTITEPANEETLALAWYSREERDDMKALLKRDVRRVSKKLATTSMQLLTKEDLCDCVGMEALLSRDKRIRRSRHARTVLAAQCHQRMLNIYDDVGLSYISMQSSKCARARANKAATGNYWDA